ncbi:glycoside hydrolase family protein [Stylonychia lemnae]|uniref:Glycoside hydrolase family protein n=1 Tax=Stylonychia lemnae TaxID=5949 RepID=A0A078A2A5_STYLE|nr:glycoside hydrolase family protein [Stylonychia lemnae]|eukprot:CDW74909.1 glycoside hydrolase family protein [Stylonychia lemnae]
MESQQNVRQCISYIGELGRRHQRCGVKISHSKKKIKIVGSKPDFQTFVPLLVFYMRKTEINTPIRIAMFLAQVAHESQGFTKLIENTNGENYEPTNGKGKNLGNTEPGDGKRFRGRGLIQLTGRYNYTYFGKLMNLDLLDKPELLEKIHNAVYVSCLYWQVRKANALADQNDFEGVTKRINGGKNGLVDRQRYYDKAKQVFDIDE